MAPIAQALLSGNSQLGLAHSQLMLLVPEQALQELLIPSGHMQAIAQRCQVRLDLDPELRGGRRQVMLSGTVLGNAAASYWIQAGIAFDS